MDVNLNRSSLSQSTKEIYELFAYMAEKVDLKEFHGEDGPARWAALFSVEHLKWETFEVPILLYRALRTLRRRTHKERERLARGFLTLRASQMKEEAAEMDDGRTAREVVEDAGGDDSGHPRDFV